MRPERTWWDDVDEAEPISIDPAKAPSLTAYSSTLETAGELHRFADLPEDEVQSTARTLALHARLLWEELGN